MWEYQVNLDPNETKNIWLINGTYHIAQLFVTNVVLINDGAYPLTPTPTPTNTPTPTQTSTNTPTPTQTPTNTNTPTNTTTPTNTPTNTTTPTNTPTNTNTPTPTNTPTNTNTSTNTNTPTNTTTPTNTPTQTPTQTPTNTTTPTNTPTPTVTPTNALDVFNITSGSTSNIACAGGLSGTIYGENSQFDTNTQFYNNSNGTVSGDMSGFYSIGGQVVQLTSGGTETGGFTACSALPSPTPTITPTNTPTNTPTSTPTNTPTPTITPTASQTFFVGYSLGTGSTSGAACLATPQIVYGAYPDRPQPNIGETLYNNSSLTITAPNGYYSNGTAWWQITGGSGVITATDPNGC
jgi:hypothetical protein